MLEFILPVILEVILVVILKDSSFRDSLGPVTVLRVNILMYSTVQCVDVLNVLMYLVNQKLSNVWFGSTCVDVGII